MKGPVDLSYAPGLPCIDYVKLRTDFNVDRMKKPIKTNPETHYEEGSVEIQTSSHRNPIDEDITWETRKPFKFEFKLGDDVDPLLHREEWAEEPIGMQDHIIAAMNAYMVKYPKLAHLYEKAGRDKLEFNSKLIKEKLMDTTYYPYVDPCPSLQNFTRRNYTFTEDDED